MPVIPRKHIANLHRVANEDVNRSDYLCLDKNENIIGFSDEVLNNFCKMITPNLLNTYPDASPLYKNLTEKLNVDPGQIYLSSGSDAAIKSVFETYVNPGDEVVLISPTYAMYYVYARMFQAKLEEFIYDHDLFIPPEKIISKISPATKLVCIPNPNSTTGTIFSQKDLINIVCTARKHGALVLIDEAYQQFHGESMMDYLNESNNLIIVRTFSKAMGLASARLGYIVSNDTIITNLFKVRPLYEVNSFAICFGTYLLDHPEIQANHLEEISRSKNYLKNKLSELGFPITKSHTNFVLINVNSKRNSKEIVRLLLREKIFIKGEFKEACLESYIRVTLGSIEQMKIFIKKLEQILKEITKESLQ